MDPTLDVGNPFPGPQSYRQDQKDLFFGRSNEIDELTSLVLSTSAVLLYAQSGSGKSSLLQAGLVPSLEDFGYRILPTVRFSRVSLEPSDGGADAPQPNPFAKLVCDTVLPDGALPPDRCGLEQLAAYLKDAGGETPALLILDQLEELFANQALWQERSAFLAQLRGALDDNPWLRAVLAIRSDYLANLLPHEGDLPGRMLIRCELESLREQAAREAIEMTFSRTDVLLTPAELDLVLDRLLSIDVGVPGSPVRGQYVNLIQLQILCRRLWREKAQPRPRKDAATPDGPPVLRESDLDLTDYMRSFVDDAVASVVSQTQSDEGVVRRWLEERLTTSAGRRAVLLVDNEEDAGLPQGILDALEKARLIQIEQRNQSQWAELTHDSMVAAVQASDKEWGKSRRRQRRKRTAVLAVVLGLLLVPFFLLRVPTDPTLLTRATGTLTGAALRIPFPPAPPGQVAVVHVSLSGYPGTAAAVRIVTRDPGKQQDRELARSAVATARDGSVNTATNFAVGTNKSASYAVIVAAPSLQSGYHGYLHYNVTVHSAPVILNLPQPGAYDAVQADSPLVAVKLYPHQPSYLTFLGLGVNLQQVSGVRTLMTDSTGLDFVVESPGGGYAVLSNNAPADNAFAGDVGERVLTPGPGLYLGAHADIRADNASISSVYVGPASVPFAVETSCKNNYGSISNVLDSEAGSVGSAARSVPSGSVLVPAAHGSEYRLIMLEEPSGFGLNCQVTVRSFAQQRITTLSNSKVEIDAGSSFNAYPVRLPADAVIIVTNLNGAHASLDCLSSHITESDPERLLAFVPANHDCVLSIARSSGGTGKPASFPLLIDKVPGG